MSDSSDPILFHWVNAKKSDSAFFLISKRTLDVSLSLILLPILIACVFILLAANPWLNPGRLFFVQRRMGCGCKPFHAIKFRSMHAGNGVKRTADAPLERDRIPTIGAIIRKMRIDELPQIINVLKGDMSLIGPRPDAWDHAEHFLKVVPGYCDRHAVRPGISGLAQVEIGYAEGVAATARKVRADLDYIENRGWRLELWLIWRTLVIVFGCRGM